jgi:hypothetical protein
MLSKEVWTKVVSTSIKKCSKLLIDKITGASKTVLKPDSAQPWLFGLAK